MEANAASLSVCWARVYLCEFCSFSGEELALKCTCAHPVPSKAVASSDVGAASSREGDSRPCYFLSVAVAVVQHSFHVSTLLKGWKAPVYESAQFAPVHTLSPITPKSAIRSTPT